MFRIYQPTPAEIQTVIARAAERAPSLQSRLQRAAELLHGDAIHWRAGGWHCESQQKDKHYSVDFRSCGCYDFTAKGATVGCHVFCKHKLALLALNEIAGNQMQHRCLGAYFGSADLRRARLAPNAALLLLEHGPAMATVANADHHMPTRVCATRWTERGHRPANEGELHKFLLWLAQAQPFAVYADAPAGWDEVAAADAAIMPYPMWRHVHADQLARLMRQARD